MKAQPQVIDGDTSELSPIRVRLIVWVGLLLIALLSVWLLDVRVMGTIEMAREAARLR